MATQRPKHVMRFNVEGKVFTCYNIDPDYSVLRSVPGQLPLAEDYSPRYLRRTHFQYERYPYLAFIPESLDRSGPILGRFRNPKIVKDGYDGYRLDPVLEASWYRLGHAVRHMARHLWNCLDKRPPIMLNEYTRPERYGYMFTHDRQSDAEERANESIGGFTPLLAMLTFVIALHQFGPGSTPSETGVPQWCKYVTTMPEFGPQIGSYLNDIRMSQITDFRCKRVGVILDFAMSINKQWWADYLDVYIKAGVPIYINWGRDYAYVPPNSSLDKYRPELSEFAKTLSEYEAWHKNYVNRPIEKEKGKGKGKEVHDMDRYISKRKGNIPSLLSSTTFH